MCYQWNYNYLQIHAYIHAYMYISLFNFSQKEGSSSCRSKYLTWAIPFIQCVLSGEAVFLLLLLICISSSWLKRFFKEFHFHQSCCLWLNPLALGNLQSLMFLCSRNLNVSWILFKGEITIKHMFSLSMCFND